MTQPYSPHQVQSGLVPSGDAMPTSMPTPPVAECQAAVDASIDADDFSVQHASNMAYPGMHVTGGGVDPAGGNNL